MRPCQMARKWQPKEGMESLAYEDHSEPKMKRWPEQRLALGAGSVARDAVIETSGYQRVSRGNDPVVLAQLIAGCR
jgi:hypothetical protein